MKTIEQRLSGELGKFTLIQRESPVCDLELCDLGDVELLAKECGYPSLLSAINNSGWWSLSLEELIGQLVIQLYPENEGGAN